MKFDEVNPERITKPFDKSKGFFLILPYTLPYFSYVLRSISFTQLDSQPIEFNLKISRFFYIKTLENLNFYLSLQALLTKSITQFLNLTDVRSLKEERKLVW